MHHDEHQDEMDYGRREAAAMAHAEGVLRAYAIGLFTELPEVAEVRVGAPMDADCTGFVPTLTLVPRAGMALSDAAHAWMDDPEVPQAAHLALRPDDVVVFQCDDVGA